MLALLGALKEELAGIKRLMAIEETISEQGCQVYKGKYQGRGILLAQTGMGREKAEFAASFVLQRYPVTTLVSFGFAGALTGELKVGDVILCSTLACGEGMPGLHKSCQCDISLVTLLAEAMEEKGFSFQLGTSVSVIQPVSSPEAKQALGQTFAADIVDMESYWLARIAADRGIPFLAIRAISDEVSASLAPFDRIMTPDGKWRWQKAVPYYISHPTGVGKLLHLSRDAGRARKSLTEAVSILLASMN
ncbi:MAG: hypothetical protein HY665_07820 [Chloroflexi bacterium]|nr:hypothetical protein [Chloroflexota bacterium]